MNAQCNKDEQAGYHAWLSQYTEKLSQMDEYERGIEDRLDYREESQAYPDYLDYVEEWEWFADEQLSELKSKLILAYSKRHQKLKCECNNYHILTTCDKPDAGDTITDDPSRVIYNTCWYKTIAQELNSIKLALKGQSLLLPDPMHNMLHNILKWKMVDNNQTPILLPFETFKAIWWSSKDQAALGKELLRDMKYHEVMQIVHMREDQTPEIKDEGKKVLLNFPDSDHGFHQLIYALKDQGKTIFNWMNKQRSKLGLPTDQINYERYKRKTLKCKSCRRGHFPGISVPGVYYAPPGGGKTTALNNGVLVGFDTDWIGVGLSWRDYTYLLRKGIPIITNQPEIFIGSGVKIIGILKKHIREVNGKPLDTYQHLRQWASQHSRNVLFIDVKDDEFLTHYATKLQSLQLMQSIIANHAINQKPFYNNETSIEWLKAFPKLLRNRERQVLEERKTELLISTVLDG